MKKIGEKSKKKQIYNWLSKWIEILGLQNWDIAVKFGLIKEKQSGIFKDHARTDMESTYFTATITFNKKLLKTINEDTVIHELVHLFFGEIHGYLNSNFKIKNQNWLDYFEERQISQFERILKRLADAVK